MSGLSFVFQHSPSNRHESKLSSEVLDFWGWECLCECVSNHFSSWTIDEPERAVFNDPADKMEADVDVFGSGMVLVVFGKCDC